MERKYVIAAIVILFVGTGGVVFLNSDTTIQDLNSTVVSEEDLGADFEQTHETFANSSSYERSAIQLRVDRRFTDSNGTVVLSSATVYSSEDDAERVRNSFIARTADNVTTADFGSGEIAKIYQDVPTKDVIYFYQQKENKIYFVSVASNSGYKEEKAKELMKEMQPEGLISNMLS